MKIITLLKNVLRIRTVTLPKLFVCASFVVTLSTSSVFAAAFCITNPNGWPGDPFDNRCPVTATIYPEVSPISSGSSVNIILYANTLYQWFVNGLVAGEATMTDTVTGVSTTLSNGPPYITGTWSQSVPSGPLIHSASLSFWAESDQGVIDTDSSFVTVNSAPPSVDIRFSFFQKVKDLFSGLL